MGRQNMGLAVSVKTLLLVSWVCGAQSSLLDSLEDWKKVVGDQRLVRETRVEFDASRAPVITVKRINKGAGGWKIDDPTEYLSARCDLTQSFQDILACIQSNTFTLDQTLAEVLVGPKENLVNISVTASPEYSDTWTGKTYRLEQGLVWDSYQLNLISFPPDDTAQYWIDIHDPTFYFSSYQSGALPRSFKQLKARSAYSLEVEVIYHEREDREEERCEVDEGYSFTACVKNSVST